MIRIVTLSREQFAELCHKIKPEQRWIVQGFSAPHLYLVEHNLIVMMGVDLQVREFPEEGVVSLVSAIQCAYDLQMERKC